MQDLASKLGHMEVNTSRNTNNNQTLHVWQIYIHWGVSGVNVGSRQKIYIYVCTIHGVSGIQVGSHTPGVLCHSVSVGG